MHDRIPAHEQTLVLAGLGTIPGWAGVAARYATETAGWYQRSNGLLLCDLHTDHGDMPLPTRSPPA